MENLTTRVIANEIDGYIFKGDTLEFLASFISYCNDRTTFGVPHKCCLFDSDMPLEFGTLTVRVSDAAIDTSFSNGYLCFYTIEKTDEKHTVCVTPYFYDEEFDEVSPELYYTPTFDVSNPHDLETLCDYFGVMFAPSFFE